MPLSISSIAIEEKNKLATDSVWYICLKITIPATPSNVIVYIVRNSEDISWAGQTWQAFPFELDEITAENKGEVPRVDIRVSNVSRVMENYILTYDNYIKTNGYEPIVVDLYIVNSRNLASSTPEVAHQFELKKPKMTAQWATFTLGAANPYNQRYPKDRILKDHCRHKFKDTRCKYSGGTSTCNKTFAACTAMANTVNYGGFPGVGIGGLRIR